MRVELTDTEWMDLIDATCELESCCGNISQLRDVIIVVASNRGKVVEKWLRRSVIGAYEAASPGHTLRGLPTLQKLMRQVYGVTDAID